MASPEFAKAVVAEMRKILINPAETKRLGLFYSIVDTWGHTCDQPEDKAVQSIFTVAHDNKIDLDSYEGVLSVSLSERAREAAEMILLSVDRFMRQATGMD